MGPPPGFAAVRCLGSTTPWRDSCDLEEANRECEPKRASRGAAAAWSALAAFGAVPQLISSALALRVPSHWQPLAFQAPPALRRRGAAGGSQKRRTGRQAEDAPHDHPLEAEAGLASHKGASVAAGSSAGVLARLLETQRDNLKLLALGIVSALVFGSLVTLNQGGIAGSEWFSCYVIEYALSVDNLFVFIVIFDYFKVSNEMQSKVLNYGIVGAIVLRFLFVYLGAQLLQQYQFLILIFAAILVYASYKGLAGGDDEEEERVEDSAVFRTLKSVIDISPTFDGDKFFTEVAGRTVATPLLLCLLVIEFSDIVFATDSVPAVLGTTQDPFIAYTSNIFAVFGLRSLFFLLREAMTRFSYLEPAVSLVLGFIGTKIVLDYFKIFEVPVLASLAIVVSILFGGVALSLQELADDDPKGEGSDEACSRSDQTT